MPITGVQEYHIDGFRFDLASILTRAPSAFHPADWVGAMASQTPGGPCEEVRTLLLCRLLKPVSYNHCIVASLQLSPAHTCARPASSVWCTWVEINNT